jgi:hypothetical protein
LRKEKRNYLMSVSDYNRYPILKNEILIAAIELIQQNVNSKTKASLQIILDFLTERNLDNYHIILSRMGLKGAPALFADKE